MTLDQLTAASRDEGRGLAVVALGGGHGLSASLSALRLLSDRITAVVTLADDGGSSGRLREELGVLPPGDLRMALAALCDDSDWGRLWRDVLQHRFASDGALDRHAVGNLLIVALWEILGDPIAGLDWVGRLLGDQGADVHVAGPVGRLAREPGPDVRRDLVAAAADRGADVDVELVGRQSGAAQYPDGLVNDLRLRAPPA